MLFSLCRSAAKNYTFEVIIFRDFVKIDKITYYESLFSRVNVKFVI